MRLQRSGRIRWARAPRQKYRLPASLPVHLESVVTLTRLKPQAVRSLDQKRQPRNGLEKVNKSIYFGQASLRFNFNGNRNKLGIDFPRDLGILRRLAETHSVSSWTSSLKGNVTSPWVCCYRVGFFGAQIIDDRFRYLVDSSPQ